MGGGNCGVKNGDTDSVFFFFPKKKISEVGRLTFVRVYLMLAPHMASFARIVLAGVGSFAKMETHTGWMASA